VRVCFVGGNPWNQYENMCYVGMCALLPCRIPAILFGPGQCRLLQCLRASVRSGGGRVSRRCCWWHTFNVHLKSVVWCDWRNRKVMAGRVALVASSSWCDAVCCTSQVCTGRYRIDLNRSHESPSNAAKTTAHSTHNRQAMQESAKRNETNSELYTTHDHLMYTLVHIQIYERK
jgi:hypothetical protein